MTPLLSVHDPLPSFDQDILRGHLDATLNRLPAGLVSDAHRLFDRLTPVHWPVEWRLPWWLGRDLALGAQDVQALTVCNLLGLGYVRLQDAILDDPGSQAERRRQQRLADALHGEALHGLEALFDGQAEFWGWREEAMRQWRVALSDGERAPIRRFADWTEADFLLLAWRGAPIKITAVGACLLAGRRDPVPALLTSLDHMLTAQVLLDHLDDWQADLEAGRFNAFVAYASDLAQRPQHREANRRQVMRQFFVGDAGASYVDLIGRQIRAARRHAERIPCTGLGLYLADLEEETAASHLAVRSRIRGWLHDATAAIFAMPQTLDSAAVSSSL